MPYFAKQPGAARGRFGTKPVLAIDRPSALSEFQLRQSVGLRMPDNRGDAVKALPGPSVFGCHFSARIATGHPAA